MDEYYPLSSAQKRLYLLNQLEGMKTSYNITSIYKIQGLDKDKFEEVVKKLVKRHEAFRTSFEMIDGEMVQRIHDDLEFEIDYISNLENEKRVDEILKEFIRPFDLSKAPLFRVGLIDDGDQEFLVFDMHHIISDGTSMEILVKDFVSFYTGTEPADLRIQYKDFAIWQNDLVDSEVIKKQEEYWVERFEDAPVLNMPIDYPRPAVMSFEGETISFRFEKELTEQLNKLANQNGATLYMVLLAAYNVLLSKYTGQEDIVVGSPIAGRPHADLKNIIGMFVNTLVMRNTSEGGVSFGEFLAWSKKMHLQPMKIRIINSRCWLIS